MRASLVNVKSGRLVASIFSFCNLPNISKLRYEYFKSLFDENLGVACWTYKFDFVPIIRGSPIVLVPGNV